MCADSRAETRAEAEALSLFRASEVDYLNGHFQDAVDKLETARKLVSKPVLTYNLARAYEGLGKLPRAADEYQRYLNEAGNPPDAGAIRTRITGIRRSIEEMRESEARRAAAEEAAKRAEEGRQRADTDRARLTLEAESLRRGTGPSRGSRIGGWTLFGLGLATLAGGAVSAGLARRDHGIAVSTATAQLDAQHADASSRRYALGANIALPIGGGIALAGFVWGTVVEVRLARARRSNNARATGVTSTP